MSKILKWLLSALVVDPLVLLFICNIIISAMFNTGKTTFWVCLGISIFVNIIWTAIKNCRDTASNF